MKRRKASCIGHTVRRHCLLKHVIEEKIERRIDWREDEEEGVIGYWMTLRRREDIGNLKKETLDRTVWRTRFGTGYGPVLRQTTELMNEWIHWCSVVWVTYIFVEISHIKGSPGVKVTSSGLNSRADAESKISYTHGSDWQQCRSYEILQCSN